MKHSENYYQQTPIANNDDLEMMVDNLLKLSCNDPNSVSYKKGWRYYLSWHRGKLLKKSIHKYRKRKF